MAAELLVLRIDTEPPTEVRLRRGETVTDEPTKAHVTFTKNGADGKFIPDAKHFLFVTDRNPKSEDKLNLDLKDFAGHGEIKGVFHSVLYLADASGNEIKP